MLGIMYHFKGKDHFMQQNEFFYKAVTIIFIRKTAQKSLKIRKFPYNKIVFSECPFAYLTVEIQFGANPLYSGFCNGFPQSFFQFL